MVIIVYLIFTKTSFNHFLNFSLWYFLNYHFKTFRYVRMSPERFEVFAQTGWTYIPKEEYLFSWMYICWRTSFLTLQYLASGDVEESIACWFRICKSTVNNIIRETCDAIYDSLKDKYLSKPKTGEN